MGHPPKKDVAKKLMSIGTVYVHLDPRRDGVVVPSHLRNQPQVVLQFGYGMPNPIGDLMVSDTFISGIMSFKGRRELCHIPWTAAFALVGDDGKGLFYSEDCPKEIHDALMAEAKETPEVTAMRAQIDAAQKGAPPAIMAAQPAQPPRNNLISFAAARARLRPNAQVKGSPFRPGV